MIDAQLKEELNEVSRLWADKLSRKEIVCAEGGFDRYYCRDIEEGKRYLQKQMKARRRLEAYWPQFLSIFKQECKRFCSSRETLFSDILQDILRGEDFSFVSIDSWNRGSITATPYSPTNLVFCLQFDHTKRQQWQKMAALIGGGGHWIDSFLSVMYGFYKRITKTGSETGILMRILSEEERGEASYYMHSTLRDSNLHLHSLPQAPNVFLRHLDKVPFNLPQKPRLEHQWIIGASGSGKTQLLQRMICDDIEHGRTVVVMDSQRDMIGKLLRLKHDMEVVYIDPEDIEHPPAIALFDIQFGTGAEAEARENAVIELYEYMFSVFGTELTGRQGSLFTYALRLMFVVPESNIFTLIDLFRSGDKYQRYFDRLDSVERSFFQEEFFTNQYKANRQQILAKLNLIVKNKTLRRIFANTKRKFDFFSILNRPALVLINTSRTQLGVDGCALFGRFMLSLIVDAIAQRAHIPEDRRRPTFIYVDEGKDYGNDDAFGRIIYECRKYAGGLIFCSQNIGQLSQSTVSALFTSAIKFIRAVKEPTETRKLAQSLRVKEDFIHDLIVEDRQYSEWACKIENQNTIKARVDFGYLENRSKITEAEYQAFRERNRERYCKKSEPTPPEEPRAPTETTPPAPAVDDDPWG